MKRDFFQHKITHPKQFRIEDHPTEPSDRMKDKESLEIIEKNVSRINDMQQMLYAKGSHSVLIVFQAMDAAGKDGTLRRLLTGVNPQGCKISNFKRPTPEELSHDFLWRVTKKLPPKGYIGLFNRSHYEEVLVTRVHPEYILYQNIPSIKEVKDIHQSFWNTRFERIRSYEQHLAESGMLILKFFLHVGYDEQRERIQERMDNPEKHWKFNVGDVKERAYWKEYMQSYEEAIRETSRPNAPWFVIPADDKDYMRAAVCHIVRKEMEKLGLTYPESGENIAEEIAEGRAIFAKEDAG